MVRENMDIGPVEGPTGKKYILKTVKGVYAKIMDEKCNVVKPIPCPDEVDEQPFQCALLPCNKQRELCECYELVVGETYYFVTNEKGRVVTYKILVTERKTEILEIMLTLPLACKGVE
jgi:hypothetical protein